MAPEGLCAGEKWTHSIWWVKEGEGNLSRDLKDEEEWPRQRRGAAFQAEGASQRPGLHLLWLRGIEEVWGVSEGSGEGDGRQKTCGLGKPRRAVASMVSKMFRLS